MSSSRNHQEAHGIGQIEEQLANQAEAAQAMQGENETDEAVQAAAEQERTSLDDLATD